MRSARIKESGGAYYHVISRIIERRMVLDDKEKERFRKTMRAVEAFSGVRILTYAILDNHFHVLLNVPARREISDEELVRRIGFLYDSAVVSQVAAHLRMCREEHQDAAAEAMRSRYTYRMEDISEFMKTLKQRVSQSYNVRHERNGTLWEGRFKSVLVQGARGALAAVAAYIDLNAVRAGLVSDPKDYRFCGYGEAVAGAGAARAGLAEVMEVVGGAGGWDAVSAGYREWLYVKGEKAPGAMSGRGGFSPAAVREVLQAGGRLSLPELLQCRVRYFSDGLILGTQSFVEEAFRRHREHFSAKRTSGARPMRGGFTDLFTARRLRLDVIGVPNGG